MARFAYVALCALLPVHSTALKTQKDKPVLKKPVITNGWRSDGCLGCATTPDDAEAQHGIKISRNSGLFDHNFISKHYGEWLPLDVFKVEKRTFFNTFMQVLVTISSPSFSWGRGWYQERIVGMKADYVVAGFTGPNEVVVWSPSADPGGYGLITVDPKASTKDRIVCKYRSKARGVLHLEMDLHPIKPKGEK